MKCSALSLSTLHWHEGSSVRPMLHLSMFRSLQFSLSVVGRMFDFLCPVDKCGLLALSEFSFSLNCSRDDAVCILWQFVPQFCCHWDEGVLIQIFSYQNSG